MPIGCGTEDKLESSQAVARRIDTVRIQTADQLVELPWKTAQKLRGELIGAGLHSIARQFADKGTSAPIVLGDAEKNDLLGMVRDVCMKVVSDEQARDLLPLRNALQAELEQGPGGEPNA